MTQVDFYSPVGDKFGFIQKLAQKAFSRGWRVLVWARNQDHARQLDEALWTFQPQSFLPHCGLNAPLAAETPLLIGSDQQAGEGALPHHDLLINLSDAIPKPFARFERLVELVGLDAEEAARCRERWRFYQERGYPMNHHKLGESA